MVLQVLQEQVVHQDQTALQVTQETQANQVLQELQVQVVVLVLQD